MRVAVLVLGYLSCRNWYVAGQMSQKNDELQFTPDRLFVVLVGLLSCLASPPAVLAFAF